MKRLLALFLLAVAPAFAQEYTPPTVNDPVVEQTYTLNQSPTTSLQNVNQTGTALTLYDDGTTYTPIQLPFDFYYYGNLYNSVYISQNGFISFTSNANGCCSGNQLPFISEDPYYNMNNSIFAMWSDLADFSTGNPYYQAFADRFTVGWYGVDELGTANKFTFEITLFDNSKIGITYGDFDYTGQTGRLFTSGIQGDTMNEFWQIYYGNDPLVLENQSYLFSTNITLPPPPPPQFPFWNRVAGEYESFTLTEQAVIRYGAEGVYAYQTLEAGTYDCGNSIFGDPIGGVVKSCEIGSNEPPPSPPPVVNCVTNPLDPTCIIEDLTDFTDEPVMLVDTTTNSAPVNEEDPAPEELVAVEESVTEESSEEALEELLADDSAEEDFADKELVADVKEMVNEEKAAALSDSISKDVLEAALSIAADATAAGSAAGESTSSSSSSSSSSRGANETSEAVVAEAQSASDGSSGEVAVAANEGDASAELLETGRVIGQEALAATLAGTEASANESMAEAESVAATSSETSMVASDSSIPTTQSEEVAATEEIQTQESNVVVAEIAETTTEMIVAETMTQAEAVAEMSFDVGKEMMAENADQMATAEAQEAAALNIVAAAAASSEQKFDDESAKDAETTNALVDPAFAMANTFNQAPNMMSLEFLGVLKPVEKSDAEIRAEQVVAANKEQQDAINANYMEADQSGIVAAIGSEADVSAYLSQRLQDAPFYKPEDIYKNIVIKDNVRGSYFLEKGNSDTYKKMVEEQYKDE